MAFDFRVVVVAVVFFFSLLSKSTGKINTSDGKAVDQVHQHTHTHSHIVCQHCNKKWLHQVNDNVNKVSARRVLQGLEKNYNLIAWQLIEEELFASGVHTQLNGYNI